MKSAEIEAISNAAGTIKWAKMVEASLRGDASSAHFTGVKNKNLDQIWTALRNEVHDLLCTNSTKYAKERTAFAVTIKPAVAALAIVITREYGFPVAAASSLASLALLLPVRIAKEAWCAAVDKADIVDKEKEELRHLIKGSHAGGTKRK